MNLLFLQTSQIVMVWVASLRLRVAGSADMSISAFKIFKLPTILILTLDFSDNLFNDFQSMVLSCSVHIVVSQQMLKMIVTHHLCLSATHKFNNRVHKQRFFLTWLFSVKVHFIDEWWVKVARWLKKKEVTKARDGPTCHGYDQLHNSSPDPTPNPWR